MKIKITCRPRYNPWLKNLSKILAFGILLNSIPINSFASVLSEDTRYETFLDSSITISNILEEEKVDVKIEGNTLVNLMSPITINQVHWRDNNYMVTGVHTGHNFEFDSINQSWKLDIGSCTDNIFPLIKLPSELMIEGRQYSLILNSTDSITEVRNTNLDHHNINVGIKLSDIQKGRNVINFTYNSNYQNIVFGQVTPSTPVKILSNFMILEGDWTNKKIPNYFSGLQSSFEDQLVTQKMIDNGQEKVENLGKYKVNHKSISKNLFNKNNVIENKYQNYNLTTSLFTIVENNNFNISDFIEIKPNTIYTKTNIGGGAYYDKDKKVISNSVINSDTFKTPPDAKYIVLNMGKNTNRDVIQIEEGSVSTLYQPYKESIKTFYLNSPLLEGDTIEYINGQANHVHRYAQVVFDGSDDENWQYYSNYTSDTIFSAYNISINNNYKDIKVISDKIPSITANTEKPFITSMGSYIALGIKSSKLKSLDINGLREYLNQDPITVVYKLINPIYEPIKTDLSVNLFEGTTHISNNSNIPATMEITVDRAINRAVEYSELAKTNPTINNLSKARYWNNLLRESIKKDQLQEEINNLIAVNDMTLERKSVTANLDLYIKSQNALILSLNTNNITFEDFSGVEDTEKVNVVEISISSSLPYSLNAYLPTEIQNGDKSNIMNKSILNIKENSESVYQAFANTTDKIVLKDNCNSGNDLIHNIDIKLKGGIAHQKDVYKTTIKFEAEQK